MTIQAQARDWVPTAALLSVFLLLGGARARAQEPAPREDPDKITTAESCGECHVSTFEVWRKTPHATGFKTLHRKESAEAIADRLGLPLIKRQSACLNCHYTAVEKDGVLRAASGVSCESCHGAGRDWIDLHNDYGGKGFDHKNEVPEHKAWRIEESRKAGMYRPSDLYTVATNCYGCHTVPDETLVNVGRHSVGSTGFELVAWSQGDIRHNFLDSFLNGDGTVNVERSAEHKRLLYVAGRALALEHSLRGLAQATEPGVFLKAMQRRLRDATVEIKAVARRGEVAEAEEMLKAVRGVKARLGQREQLLEAAERVGELARKLLDGRDGSQLAALDPLVRGEVEAADLIEDEDEGEEASGAIAVADAGSAAGAASGDVSPSAPGSSTAAGGPSGSGSGSGSGGQAGVPAEGARKTRLRPASKHDTVSAGECQACHGDQNSWWFEDAHYAAIDPFLSQDPRNVRIARLYGISPSRMARGDNLCMDCHGTVVTGKEKREVQDGVSCQSCHGPAEDYLKPHQEGDKALGDQRPGYRKALGLGMVALTDLKARARTCSGCHYITDPRLISSGHPSGAGFDYVGGMAKIRHWEAPVAPAGTLKAAFAAAVGARGPVPQVRLARLASSAGGGGAGSGGGGQVGTGERRVDIGGDSTYRPNTPRTRPTRARGSRRAGTGGTDGSAAGGAVALGLPPLPEIDEETSVEDMLRIVQERLEQLYRAAREADGRPGGGS